MLSVYDNGIGIDPKFQERIFQPFKRLHPEGVYPGIGMGLAFARKIAERHGGYIVVESVPGQGSTFKCFIPERRMN
jgi:signal transduction histidine kinase